MNGHEFAMAKTAGIFSGAGNVAKKIGEGFGGNLDQIREAGTVSAGAITSGILGTFGVKKLMDSIMNDHRRKAMLEDLMMNDPIISEADQTKVKEYYATIHHMAPKVSADKNVVRELLQNFIKFGRVDLASIKTLADTQQKMQQGATGLKDLKI